MAWWNPIPFMAEKAQAAGAAVGRGFSNAGAAVGSAYKNTTDYLGEKIYDGSVVAKEAYQGAKATVVETHGKVVDATARGMLATKEAAVAGFDKVVDKTGQVIHDRFGPKLVGEPIEPCPTTLQAKIARQKYRDGLIEEGQQSPDPVQRQAAERLKLNCTAVERARLAENVYDDKALAPLGWSRMSQDPEGRKDMSLTMDMLQPTDSAFRADVYKSDIDGSIVTAYKGTTWYSPGDWNANLGQGFAGNSDYYKRAIKLGEAVNETTNGQSETAGHSLGAGMNSATSLVTGAKGWAFNPAGVHPGTLAPYGATRDSPNAANIQTFQVEGEVLAGAQDPGIQAGLLVAAAGSQIPLVSQVAQGPLAYMMVSGKPLLYDAVGQIHKLPAVDEQGYTRFLDPVRPVTKHGMARVINGLEKQKADDAQTLKPTGT